MCYNFLSNEKRPHGAFVLGGKMKNIFIKTLPVMAGYLVLGAGFGILLGTSGYGVIYALAMSVFIYAGSMQFVCVSLITGGASLFTVAITTLMVNARHLFYGVSMVSRYRGFGAKKLYLMHALTDETYSLVCQGEKESFGYYFGVSAINHLYWILGTAIGALIGTAIEFDSRGIDFSMTALFVCVFVDQWLKEKRHAPALIGVLASVGALLIFGKDAFLIPAMAVIITLLCLFRGKIKEVAK